MKTVKELLSSLCACDAAMTWSSNMTIEEIVEKCHRGDWLLWLAKSIDLSDRDIDLAKALCAETVIHLMEDERSINAVNVVKRYGNNNATDEELNAAAIDAQFVFDVAENIYDSSYFACVAAVHASKKYSTESANYTSSCAKYAAYAYAYSFSRQTYSRNFNSAKRENLLETSNICREILGDKIILRVNELLNQ